MTWRRRIAAVLALTIALLLLCAASARSQAPAEAQIAFAKADAYWTAQTGAPGPCAGYYTAAFADLPEGVAATAVGVRVYPYPPTDLPPEQFPWPEHPDWRLIGCDVQFSPVDWAGMTPTERCMVTFHEVGHYYGRDHDESGRWPVMRASALREYEYYFEPCASLEARIIVALGGYGGPNRPGWRDIKCSPWEGRVLPCSVVTADGRVVRYRARTRGDNFYIARVKSRR